MFYNKIGVVQKPHYIFCKTEMKSIEHILWDCHYVQQLIEQTEMLFIPEWYKYTFYTRYFLFGNFSRMYKGDPRNNIFLRSKQYIYKSRYFKGEFSLTALIKKKSIIIFSRRKYQLKINV